MKFTPTNTSLLLTFLITGTLVGGLYYNHISKNPSASLFNFSPEHIDGIYKLEEQSDDLACIVCASQPYLLFKSNGLMGTGIGGVTEYEIKDGFIFNKALGNSYMKIEDNNTIVGIAIAHCCKWRRISESQYKQETNE